MKANTENKTTINEKIKDLIINIWYVFLIAIGIFGTFLIAKDYSDRNVFIDQLMKENKIKK